MDLKWRPSNWVEMKGLVSVTNDETLTKLMDKLMEYTATQVLAAYWNSNEFVKDCRENGDNEDNADNLET